MLANKIPNCNQHFIEGKGHFLTENPEIWKKILLSLTQLGHFLFKKDFFGKVFFVSEL
jgi:hypothetical protein